MAVILRKDNNIGALSPVFTGPGRTVYQVTAFLGSRLEKLLSKTLSKFGHDPSILADHIEQRLGSSPEQRQSKLDALYDSEHGDPELSRLCSKLLNFAWL